MEWRKYISSSLKENRLSSYVVVEQLNSRFHQKPRIVLVDYAFTNHMSSHHTYLPLFEGA